MALEFLVYHLCLAALFVLLTQSLLLIFRANLFSLGHHGFFCLGAYTAAAALRTVLGPDLAWSLVVPKDRAEGFLLFSATVFLGALTAGLLGWVMARFLVRLRADSFAVATLIAAEVLQILAGSADRLGGALGFEVPYLVVRNTGSERHAYLVFYAVVSVGANVVLYLTLRRLELSLAGLYIAAGRDDEIAAAASGVDVDGFKRAAFTYGTAVAGAAGALFLHFTTMITPADFGFSNGLPIILYVVLGGLRLGPSIAAALSLYALYELIKLRFLGVLGEAAGESIAHWQQGILALILIASASLPRLREALTRVASRVIGRRP